VSTPNVQTPTSEKSSTPRAITSGELGIGELKADTLK
jgi:hypothetical protein